MQQVNLYLPKLKPKRELLSLENSLLLLLGIILLLSLAGYQHWNNVLAEESVANQLEQKAALLKMDNALSRERPPASEKSELEAAINGLEASSQHRLQMIAMIDQLSKERSHHSAQLESIRKTLPSSVTLQTFGIRSGATGSARFSGQTTRESDVPLFIERLLTEPPFAGVSLGPISIANTNNQKVFSVGQAPVAESK